MLKLITVKRLFSQQKAIYPDLFTIKLILGKRIECICSKHLLAKIHEK